ncbi:MAG: hypothetical protein HY236_04785 [Acidobacteria bacterium]|nr:hypothetical protein [Acidobacteriota bacterium]
MDHQQEAAGDADIRRIVEESVEEYARRAAEEKEPVLKTELAEERRKREQLERRLNELLEENSRHRKLFEQTDRYAAIKTELQRLGVLKPDLAFQVVKDQVFRGEDGQLYAHGEQGDLGLREHLAKFVSENPEFLPARIAGGSGASGGRRPETEGSGMDLSRIRPGMSEEEKRRVRREIARVAGKEVLDWL